MSTAGAVVPCEMPRHSNGMNFPRVPLTASRTELRFADQLLRIVSCFGDQALMPSRRVRKLGRWVYCGVHGFNFQARSFNHPDMSPRWSSRGHSVGGVELLAYRVSHSGSENVIIVDPDSTATYWRRLNRYEIGGAMIVAPVWYFHSTLPVFASSATKWPSRVPANTRPPAVETSPLGAGLIRSNFHLIDPFAGSTATIAPVVGSSGIGLPVLPVKSRPSRNSWRFL